MSLQAQQASTVLGALILALKHSAEYNSSGLVAPAAVLWPDGEGQWLALLPRLRNQLPELLTLGPYDPSARSGPAIWLRCMIARTLHEAQWPDSAVPILYLPGVSRADLRAIESCPKELKPLAELQYRGVFFSQLNAKDWTIRAFLQSNDGGLGLDVATDNATLEAMSGAVEALGSTPIDRLRGRRLEAADFHDIVKPDPERDVLVWLDDPAGSRKRWEGAEWQTFRAICKDKYAFDPQTDGEIVAAESLGKQECNWAGVWRRFTESPALYPNIPKAMRKVMPDDLFIMENGSVWPQTNDKEEADLCRALTKVAVRDRRTAGAEIKQHDERHGGRRSSVWARAGESPLACALKHLAVVADITASDPGGATAEDMARQYTQTGWQADLAVLEALNCVKSQNDIKAVAGVIRAMYLPWMEAGATKLQELMKTPPLPRPPVKTDVEPGECVVFADGLRYDLGQSMVQHLNAHGFEVESHWNWAAFPTVTSTSKPAVSPVSELLIGTNAGEEFRPSVALSGKTLQHHDFVKLLEDIGIQALSLGATGDPAGRAWTEAGEFDKHGHHEGWKLAWRKDENLRGIVERVKTLLDAGWKRVRVVTDHGWLLVPGGLPKTEMPHYLAETRWGRCAMLKQTAKSDLLELPWHWSPMIPIAVAPGISTFRAGLEYAHGGISLQECVTPMLQVTASAAPVVTARIRELKWAGMRCRIKVDIMAVTGLFADLRAKPADPNSSFSGGCKMLNDKGEAALVVADDGRHGDPAAVVVVNAKGDVLAKLATTVGGEE
ncbi:MAG: BREX-1 system phosphatase PglZ type B [bacterium]